MTVVDKETSRLARLVDDHPMATSPIGGNIVDDSNVMVVSLILVPAIMNMLCR